MKKITTFLIILSLIFLTSCFKKNDEMLEKQNSWEIIFSWSINSWEIEKIDNNSGKIEEKNEQIKEQNKNTIEEKDIKKNSEKELKKDEEKSHNSEKETTTINVEKNEDVNKETEKIEKELDNLLKELDLINNSSQN